MWISPSPRRSKIKNRTKQIIFINLFFPVSTKDQKVYHFRETIKRIGRFWHERPPEHFITLHTKPYIFHTKDAKFHQPLAIFHNLYSGQHSAFSLRVPRARMLIVLTKPSNDIARPRASVVKLSELSSPLSHMPCSGLPLVGKRGKVTRQQLFFCRD